MTTGKRFPVTLPDTKNQKTLVGKKLETGKNWKRIPRTFPPTQKTTGSTISPFLFLFYYYVHNLIPY